MRCVRLAAGVAVLVISPSDHLGVSGKSTLFNALTRAGCDEAVAVPAAKVGAAPFTTIEPNIGAHSN